MPNSNSLRKFLIEQKPDYYDFANYTKMMTGEQVIAAFAEEE